MRFVKSSKNPAGREVIPLLLRVKKGCKKIEREREDYMSVRCGQLLNNAGVTSVKPLEPIFKKEKTIKENEKEKIEIKGFEVL